jgi:hypothetical protein
MSAMRAGMQDDLDRLIDELLTRELRPGVREDLGEFRRQLAAGTLASDDARYIRALHARVVGGDVPKARPKGDDVPAASAKSSEVERLRAELAESRQSEQALAAERDRLQSEIAALRRELDALKSPKA